MLRWVLGFLCLCCTAGPTAYAQQYRPGQPATLLLALPFAANDTASRQNIFMGMTASTLLAAEDAQRAFNISARELRVALYNNWNTGFLRTWPISVLTSGGFSSAATYDAVMSEPNVIGIIGDYFSRTTSFTAAVASALQRPLCGGSQGSLFLSNKKNYPYFIRTQPGRGWNTGYVFVLKQYGMRRLCIVQGANDLSASSAFELRTAADRYGIKHATILLPSSAVASGDLDFIMSRIRRLECRFVFLSVNQVEVPVVYDSAIANEMVGPEYLWASFQPFRTEANDFPPLYQGTWYLQTRSRATPETDFFSRFWNYTERNAVVRRQFPWVNITRLRVFYNGTGATQYVRETYNCVMSMLAIYARERQAKQLANLTEVFNYMSDYNFSVFREPSKTSPRVATPADPPNLPPHPVDYTDFVNEPVRFDEFGDQVQNASVVAISLNASNYRDSERSKFENFFGYTLDNHQSYVERFPPAYAMNGTQPPYDPEEVEQVNYIIEGTIYAIVIRFFHALGALGTLTSLLLLALSKAPVAPPFLTFPFSNALAVLSTLWMVNRFSAKICLTPVLLFLALLSVSLGAHLYAVVCAAWWHSNPRRLRAWMLSWTSGGVAVLALMAANYAALFGVAGGVGNETLTACGLLGIGNTVLMEYVLAGINGFVCVAIFVMPSVLAPSQFKMPYSGSIRISTGLCLGVIIIDLIIPNSQMIVKNMVQSILLNFLPAATALQIYFDNAKETSRAKTSALSIVFQNFPSTDSKSTHGLSIDEKEPTLGRPRLSTTPLGSAYVRSSGGFGWSKEKHCYVMITSRGASPRITFFELASRKATEINLSGLKPNMILRDTDDGFAEEAEVASGAATRSTSSIDKAFWYALLSVPGRGRWLLRFQGTEPRDEFVERMQSLANKLVLFHKTFMVGDSMT
ncbi:hypothetical protein HDU96_003202 [Phlyctochytrium bullatum]|nr:hypothetical protein HDU96_003202 [Phlyctochytrium bullatum]